MSGGGNIELSKLTKSWRIIVDFLAVVQMEERLIES